MSGRLTRFLLGVPRDEEVRRARAQIALDRGILLGDLASDERAFVEEMRRRERAPHVALGECPPGVPFRIALEHLLAGSHGWATGSSNSGKTRLVLALIAEVLRLLLAGLPVTVIVAAMLGDIVTLVLRVLGALLQRAAGARRREVLERLMVARFATGSHLVPWDIFARPAGVPLLAHGNAVGGVLTHALGAHFGHKQRPGLGMSVAAMSEHNLSAPAFRILLNHPERIATLGRRSSDPVIASYFEGRFLRETASLDGIGSMVDGLIGLDEGLRGALAGPGGIDFQDRFTPGSITLLDFAGLESAAGKALAGLSLHSLMGAALSATRKVEGPTLFVIDEAQLAFTPSTASLLSDALTTIRHGRVSILLVNQSLSQLPREFVHLAATNVRYRWVGRSGDADASLSQEFLPRTGRVPKPRPPFTPPGERVEMMSRAEELAFRIAECGALPQGAFFVTERAAPFGVRRLTAPRIDPPAWEAFPEDLREALERGGYGIPRAEIIARGRQIEAEVLRSLAVAEESPESGSGSRTSARGRRGVTAPRTPDAITRAAGWGERKGGRS